MCEGRFGPKLLVVHGCKRERAETTWAVNMVLNGKHQYAKTEVT